MNRLRKIGFNGERLALDYLERFGYQLVEQNYRIGRGEIDLMVIKEWLLVFVEVKTNTKKIHSYLVEDKVSWYQQQKIKETAYRYLSRTDWSGSIRFDLVLVNLHSSPEVDHYPGYLD